MGTTAQKLQAIQNSKAAIKAAIEAKGVSNVGDVLSEYATKIASIPSGGGSKYGITVDGLIGDVDGQGVLQAPNETFTFTSNDIVEIGFYMLDQFFMANECLTGVSLPNLTTVEAHGLESTFERCTNLETLSLPSLVNHYDEALSGLCNGCTSLETVNLSSLTHINGTEYLGAFDGCTSLVSIDISSMETIDFS